MAGTLVLMRVLLRWCTASGGAGIVSSRTDQNQCLQRPVGFPRPSSTAFFAARLQGVPKGERSESRKVTGCRATPDGFDLDCDLDCDLDLDHDCKLKPTQ